MLTSKNFHVGRTACIAVFVGLCLFHYFSLRPLWIDERLVFESFTERDYPELFSRLKNGQTFPRVYLAAIKAFAAPWNNHLLAVRFFSLVSMLSAYFCWIKLYSQKKEQGLGLLLMILAMTCTFRFSYYASELKPYSLDVFVVALYTWFLIDQRRFETQRPTTGLYVMAAVLPLLMFFSYGSLFVVWMAAFNFLLMLKANHSLIRPLVVNLISVAICFMAVYRLDLAHSMNEPTMHEYFQDSFIHFTSLSAFFSPLGEGIRRLGTWWYGNGKFFIRAATPFIFFFLYGLGRYGFKQLNNSRFRLHEIGAIGCALIVELFVMGCTGKYPFIAERITLFLAPFVIYFTVQGIEDLRRFKVAHRFAVAYFVIYLLAALIHSFQYYWGFYTGIP
ncbi:MAG: hypothetical protein Q7S13_05590, partial [Candidatus Omnitrophota bacterium]|nr:hypothetical protein [Candidatus Omnitrophota bacterium]